MAALKYWVWLTTLPGLTDSSKTLLMEHFSSPEDVYYAREEALWQVDGLKKEQAALLAEREAQLEKEQAEFAAAKERGEEGKKSFLNNNDPNFVNPKEKLYDKFPLTVHQMDIIIGVLFALILLFLVLGMTHTSFFGLFGG